MTTLSIRVTKAKPITKGNNEKETYMKAKDIMCRMTTHRTDIEILYIIALHVTRFIAKKNRFNPIYQLPTFPDHNACHIKILYDIRCILEKLLKMIGYLLSKELKRYDTDKIHPRPFPV